MPLTAQNYTDIGTTVVGGLGTIFGSRNNRKAAEAEANAMRENAQAQERIAQLALEGEKLKAQTALALAQAKPQGNKTLYIALGVGAVVVLGVVIFAVTRKKA